MKLMMINIEKRDAPMTSLLSGHKSLHHTLMLMHAIYPGSDQSYLPEYIMLVNQSVIVNVPVDC